MVIGSPDAVALNPPCGSTLVANTTLTGSISCATLIGYNVGAPGITINCKSATITGSGTGTGIFDNGFPNVVIKGCTVKNFYYGIGVVFTKNVTLSRNKAYNNLYCGFVVGAMNDSLVTRNYATGSRSGFFVNDTDNTVISFNVATASVSPVGGPSNSGDGFDIYGINNQVLSNLATVNSGDGFALALHSSTVLGNVATANGKAGLSLGNSATTTMFHNMATKNLQDGFILTSSSNDVLIDNGATSNTVNGFHFSNAKSNNIIQNTASKNGLDGFHFESNSTSNQVIDNRSYLNTRYRCYDGTGVTGLVLNFYVLNNGTPVGPAFSFPPGLFPA